MKLLFYRYGSICEPDVISGFCTCTDMFVVKVCGQFLEKVP